MRLRKGVANGRCSGLATACVLAASACAVVASAGQAQSAPGFPAVVVERGGNLYAIALNGSRTVQLTTRPLSGLGSDPVVSPDGTRVAFGARSGISVARRDGSGRKVVTRGADGSPAWTADGKRIYFVRYRTNRFGADCGSIFSVSVAGGAVRRITDSSPTGHSHQDPAVSPDGTRIAFTDWDACEGGTASPRLRVVDVHGQYTTDLARLAHNGYYPDPEHSCPAWSPDGTRLAYRWNADLAVANRAGSGQRRLVSGRRFLIYEPPSWSPDGRWIAYVRYGEKGLLIVHPDGTGLRRLPIDGPYQLAGWLRRLPPS